MKAKEMYIQATGDKEPDNQIFYNWCYFRVINRMNSLNNNN